jgi:hypothetical protein
VLPFVIGIAPIRAGFSSSTTEFFPCTLFIPALPSFFDFGVTGVDFVRRAYDGTAGFPEGAFKNLRMIARIENPSYLMVAVTKESGITDLKQVRERRMPVRILAGVGGLVARYWPITT